MEVESVLSREPYTPFSQDFSDGDFGTSLSMRNRVGEI